MPKGIIIAADEAVRPFSLMFNDLKDYQSVVGGLIEAIDLNNPPASLFINEEGKLIDLPMNRRATLLLWLHNSAFRMRDAIYGDVVLIGRPDAHGETQSVPPELYDFIFEDEQSFKVEVQTSTDPKWYGNQARYDDYFNAANAALGLYERWMLAEDVRVVAA